VDSRLLAYLYCFNYTKDYFACHEYLESLWLDSGRPAIQQGLIQAAVCLYHLYNGNIRGTLRMWSRAKPRLTQKESIWEGIDLANLVDQMDALVAALPLSWTQQTVSPDAVKRLQLPDVVIQLTSSALRSQVASCTLPELPID
jgi:uncharacterized protein